MMNPYYPYPESYCPPPVPPCPPPMQPIVISRYSDSDAFDARTIRIVLGGNMDITDCTATFELLTYKKEFTKEEVNEKILTLVFDQATVVTFPVGPAFATLKLYDTEGRVLSVINRINFFVTNEMRRLEPATIPVGTGTSLEVQLVVETNGTVTIPLDDEPTEGSEIAVKSGGVYSWVNAKEAVLKTDFIAPLNSALDALRTDLKAATDTATQANETANSALTTANSKIDADGVDEKIKTHNDDETAHKFILDKIAEAISAAIVFKGTVESYADLQAMDKSTLTNGDLYITNDNHEVYVWNANKENADGTKGAWDQLSGFTIDTSDFVKSVNGQTVDTSKEDNAVTIFGTDIKISNASDSKTIAEGKQDKYGTHTDPIDGSTVTELNAQTAVTTQVLGYGDATVSGDDVVSISPSSFDKDGLNVDVYAATADRATSISTTFILPASGGTIAVKDNIPSVDDALSDASENPVQNKVVTQAIGAKQDTLTAGEGIAIDSDTNVISSSLQVTKNFISPYVESTGNNTGGLYCSLSLSQIAGALPDTVELKTVQTRHRWSDLANGNDNKTAYMRVQVLEKDTWTTAYISTNSFNFVTVNGVGELYPAFQLEPVDEDHRKISTTATIRIGFVTNQTDTDWTMGYGTSTAIYGGTITNNAGATYQHTMVFNLSWAETVTPQDYLAENLKQMIETHNTAEDAHENIVSSLDTKISAAQSKADETATSLATLTSRVDDAETTITNNTGDITGLRSAITDGIVPQIESLQTTVNSLSSSSVTSVNNVEPSNGNVNVDTLKGTFGDLIYYGKINDSTQGGAFSTSSQSGRLIFKLPPETDDVVTIPMSVNNKACALADDGTPDFNIVLNAEDIPYSSQTEGSTIQSAIDDLKSGKQDALNTYPLPNKYYVEASNYAGMLIGDKYGTDKMKWGNQISIDYAYRIDYTNVDEGVTFTYTLQQKSGTLALTSDIPTVDATLSDSSTNPVQNKAVKVALDTLQNSIVSLAGKTYTEPTTFNELLTTFKTVVEDLGGTFTTAG